MKRGFRQQERNKEVRGRKKKNGEVYEVENEDVTDHGRG